MSAPVTLRTLPIYYNNSSVLGAASVNQAGIDDTGYKRLKGALSLPNGTAAPTTIQIKQGNDVTNWSSVQDLVIDMNETSAQVYPVDVEIKYPYVGIFFTQGAGAAVLRAYVAALPA